MKEFIKTIKTYCVQDRIYCRVCNKSYSANNYANHLKSQGHVNNVLKNQCTNSMIIKTHYMKRLMKAEIVINIANEGIYQLQYYKNLYLAYKKINTILLIFFSAISISLIAIHVYFYLKF